MMKHLEMLETRALSRLHWNGVRHCRQHLGIGAFSGDWPQIEAYTHIQSYWHNPVMLLMHAHKKTRYLQVLSPWTQSRIFNFNPEDIEQALALEDGRARDLVSRWGRVVDVDGDATGSVRCYHSTSRQDVVGYSRVGALVCTWEGHTGRRLRTATRDVDLCTFHIKLSTRVGARRVQGDGLGSEEVAVTMH